MDQLNNQSHTGGVKINSLTALVIVLAASAAFTVYLWQIQKINHVYYQNDTSVLMRNSAKEHLRGWQIYRNDEFGFEVKFPPLWEVKIAQDGNKTKIEFIGQDDLFSNLVASVGFVPNPGLTLEEWWDISKENPEYQKVGEASLAGRKALQIKIGESDNHPRYLLISEDKGGSIFGISLDSLPEDIASGILGSFKLIK